MALALIVVTIACAIVVAFSRPDPLAPQSTSSASNPNIQAALVTLPAGIPEDAVRYSVLIAGNKAGVDITWRTSDDTRRVFFAYNDRGRGPQIEETYVIAPDGTLRSLKISGADYYKTPIIETFSVEQGRAYWKNQAEDGEKPVQRAVYVSMNGGPDDLATILRAASIAGGTVTLLPDGEARVRKVAEKSLQVGDNRISVSLETIEGLSLSPSYVWVDESNELFATGDSWLFTVRDGWETTSKQLIDAQLTADRGRVAAMAGDLLHKPVSGLVIRNVNVFDSAKGKVVKDQTVVVQGDKIRSVGATNHVRVPAQALVIDGTGKTLLPGLWDMHAHVADPDGLLNLLAGVTTVRDLANDADELQARRRRIEAGTEVGTRIIPAGIIDGPGPYQGPTTVLADTELEARRDVQEYAARGYPQIKIYSSLKPTLVSVVIDEAHRRGLRVSGHIPAGMIAEEAVRAGIDEIQHANFLMLNFMPDVKDKTQTAARLTEVARRGADIDVDSKPVQAFIALLKSHQVAIDPTLALFEERFVNRPGQIPASYESVASRLPAQFRRSLLVGSLPLPEGMDQRYRDSFANMIKLVKAMYDAGITVESGTDSIAGFTLQRELELHVKAGIPPERVLADATLGAARIMKKDGQLGSVAPGKLADLVLVNGDPTTRISDIRRTALIVKDGTVYYPSALSRALGMSPGD
jgi:imidazolonepropionase-like amidohydrolase